MHSASTWVVLAYLIVRRAVVLCKAWEHDAVQRLMQQDAVQLLGTPLASIMLLNEVEEVACLTPLGWAMHRAGPLKV